MREAATDGAPVADLIMSHVSDGCRKQRVRFSKPLVALDVTPRHERTEIDTLDPYTFSIRVSDILRRYVTEQYQLPLTRQTSVEFLAALANSSAFSEDDESLLGDFLNRCDLIKFARYDATNEDSRLLLNKATRFVEGGKLEPA